MMRAFVANGPAYTFLDLYQKKNGWDISPVTFWELIDGGPPDKTLA